MSFVLISSDLSLFCSSINFGTFYTWRNWGAERISFFIFFCPYVHSQGILTLFQGFFSHLGICADGIHILKAILHPSSGLQIQGLFLWDAFVVFCLVTQSCPTLNATPWTIAHQAPLSMGFFRQEYWSGLPCPALGDLPNPDIESVSPALAGGFFTAGPSWKPVVF